MPNSCSPKEGALPGRAGAEGGAALPELCPPQQGTATHTPAHQVRELPPAASGGQRCARRLRSRPHGALPGLRPRTGRVPRFSALKAPLRFEGLSNQGTPAHPPAQAEAHSLALLVITSARPLKPSQLSEILSGVRTTPEAPCCDGRLRGCCVASPALAGPSHRSQFFDTADRQCPGLLSLPRPPPSPPAREQRHPETAGRRRTRHPQHHARDPRLAVEPRKGRTPVGSTEPAPSLSGEDGCESAAPGRSYGLPAAPGQLPPGRAARGWSAAGGAARGAARGSPARAPRSPSLLALAPADVYIAAAGRKTIRR